MKMGRGCCGALCLLLQITAQIVLFIKQADSSVADKTIRMGYLWQFNKAERAGAINVGIESARRDGLLPGFNYRYKCYRHYAAFEIVQDYIGFSDKYDRFIFLIYRDFSSSLD